MSLLDTASLIVTPNGYKEGKLYSVIPSDGSGDMSVTRATTATRVNAAGLVELVPYNLLAYSEQFDNAAWTKTNAIITENTAAAPNGALTANSFTTTATDSYIFQGANVNVGQYTFSFYVKGTSSTIGKQVSVLPWFAGTAIGDNIVTTYTITSEWQRITRTFTVLGGGVMYLRFNCPSQSTASVNDLTYIWGAQLVEGSNALDYQRTETRLNIPRLDYSNGSCPSLLVEPQRTNSIVYSQDFSNAAWDKQGAIITANDTTAPDGTLTADKVVFSGANKTIRQALNMAGATITASVYIKGTAGQTIGIDDIFATQQVVTLTGEWQRVQFTAASPNGYGLGISTFGGVTATTIWVWGAQLEAGAYPTSYIPTTSASVTRNADVISKTGISSLIGQTEGTFFVDFYATNGVAPILINLATSNQIFSEGIYLEYGPSSGSLSLRVYTNGVLVGGVTKTGINLGTRYKVSVAYKANDTAMYIDGVLVAGAIQPNAIQSSLSQLYLGNLAGLTGNATFTGAIVNAAALWKTRLTNAQLAQLTTI